MYDVVVEKLTFAISSPDEFLVTNVASSHLSCSHFIVDLSGIRSNRNTDKRDAAGTVMRKRFLGSEKLRYFPPNFRRNSGLSFC